MLLAILVIYCFILHIFRCGCHHFILYTKSIGLAKLVMFLKNSLNIRTNAVSVNETIILFLVLLKQFLSNND